MISVIFDGNNLLHRAYHKFSNFTDVRGDSTSAIYGVPFMIESVIRKFQPDIAFVVFDGARSKKRLKLCPGYKGHRDTISVDREDLIRQKGVCMDMLTGLGLPVVHNKDQEADDMIYILVRMLQKQNIDTIIIISSDKDFNQLAISRDVVIYNPHNQEKITVNTCKHFKGYEAKQTVDYLSLIGDDSDNIPGYPQMGEKRTMQFLEEHGSIKSFLNNPKAKHSILDKEKLKELYSRNKLLIGLRAYYLKYNRGVIPEWYGNNPFPTPDKNKFTTFCGLYNIKAFLKEKNFYETFANLYKRSQRIRKNNLG